MSQDLPTVRRSSTVGITRVLPPSGVSTCVCVCVCVCVHMYFVYIPLCVYACICMNDYVCEFLVHLLFECCVLSCVNCNFSPTHPPLSLFLYLSVFRKMISQFLHACQQQGRTLPPPACAIHSPPAEHSHLPSQWKVLIMCRQYKTYNTNHTEDFPSQWKVLVVSRQ